MENKKVSIKSALLKLFNEGKSEAEALEEVSKTHSSHNVSEKTVNKWYEKFSSENQNLDNSKLTDSKKKITDEILIDLINKNPKLSMEKLANVAGVSRGTIFNRIKQLKSANEKVNYCDKDNYKFTDEFLIDLVNKNPTLNMNELAKLAGTSRSAISIRIKQINRNGIRVNYVKKKYIPEGYTTSNPKLTYEFLADLINNNPNFNTTELAELAGVSATTIERKIKKFNKAGKTLDYCKKDTKKFTDEFLIDLINKNPGFNTDELSQLAGVSAPAIIRRIKLINGNGEGVNYNSKENTKLTNERLIELMNENPGLSMTELAKLAEVSINTISRRIKQINSSGEGVNCSFKYNVKLTNERLIDLMNENPGLSMAKLAKLAGTSATTISRKIKQINSSGVVINHTIKYKSKQKPTTSEK